MLFKVFACFSLLPPIISHLVRESVTGGLAQLPCDFSLQHNDKISIILWYKDNATKPIYILDARNGLENWSKHLPSTTLANRSNYNITVIPSVLQIWDIRETDVGRYKCRVDYKNQPTEYFFVFLKVIVPPREIIIMDIYGQRLKDLIGPYKEGSSLPLICESDGGVPPPALTWWKEDKLVQSNFTVTPQGFSRNQILLHHLRREDLLICLTCKAVNTNLSVSISSSVVLDLYLKPLHVEIIIPNKPVKANQPLELQCEIWGARPAAQVTWWKGRELVTMVTDSVSNDGNYTLSTMTIIPKVEDNGKDITCRAENTLLENSTITDVWRLVVHYAPQVKIEIRTQHRTTSSLKEWTLSLLVSWMPIQLKLTYGGISMTPSYHQIWKMA
ncbi:lachesin-like isoform X1 [Tachypleus tridentatus]|uniref:lachesin-like isoform X1 n=1 Tax=Tachypleus tridentatus TaxID=6853 RepID=UPI003FD19AC0